MKSVLILFFISLAFFPLQAQTVNQIPLAEIESEHLVIQVEVNSFQRQFNIQLDYGEWGLRRREALLMDNESGNPVAFNSVAHILNYMSGYGYELVSAYDEGDFRAIRLILRKKAGTL